jgi:HAMP domain-containing protein
MSLFLKFNVVLVSVFAVALLPAGYVSHALLQSNARAQVVENARIMMQTALATRTYTNKQIKPLLAPRLAEEFLPQSVPAYSATEIFNYIRETRPEYTYKEAALNPTNPRDRTVDWEADVVNAFRADPKLKEIIGEREGSLGRALYLGRPIQITDGGCLSCHTTPDVAPASVVKAYGTAGGYGWKLNEIIGAQLVSVPMSVPIRMADTAFRALIASLVGVFALTLLFLNALLWIVVIRPLRRLSHMADQVSTGNFDIPEFGLSGRDEVALLAGSFNRMRISLAKALKMLEEP